MQGSDPKSLTVVLGLILTSEVASALIMLVLPLYPPDIMAWDGPGQLRRQGKKERKQQFHPSHHNSHSLFGLWYGRRRRTGWARHKFYFPELFLISPPESAVRVTPLNIFQVPSNSTRGFARRDSIGKVQFILSSWDCGPHFLSLNSLSWAHLISRFAPPRLLSNRGTEPKPLRRNR